MRIAINVSAVELRAKGFVAGVRALLDDTGLEPRYLELELTETFLMKDTTSTSVVLRSLKEMCVQLALDDFGTGYSSLSYLKRFPIDTVKIDGSFVGDLATDADDASIVSAVIGMGKRLHMQVVAEERRPNSWHSFKGRAVLRGKATTSVGQSLPTPSHSCLGRAQLDRSGHRGADFHASS